MPIEQRPLKVFLCHAHSDEAAVRVLYNSLVKDGVDAWLNSEKLLPGKERELEIRKAVRESHVVVVCLSKQFNQAGLQQKEVRWALDTAMEQPEGEIFIIPARLDECEVPEGLKKFYPVDLFGDRGYEILNRSLKFSAEKKNVTTVETKNELVQGKKASVRRKNSPKEKPGTLLRSLLDIKYLSLLIALIVLLFGNNIYDQVTGHTIFADPPTQTSTTTVTVRSNVTDTPVPTESVTPDEPTFTPAPATETIVPTSTAVPPVALGEDWIAGCISTLWKPYPLDVPATERGDGCWHEPVYIFSAENGDLDFLAERRNAPAEIYGLFAPLPERGTVTVRVRLRELSNVDLWMGVFAEADIDSQGLLMIIPSGDVKKRVFVQKDAPSYETITGTRILDQGNGFSISFNFTANSVKSTVNPSVFVTNPASIPSSQKWLFLGYKGLGGSYRIDGTFLSFELR